MLIDKSKWDIERWVIENTGHSASAIGAHFIGDYTECQRLFFFKHVLGLENPIPAFYLTRGVIVHVGIEMVLQGFNLNTINQVMEELIGIELNESRLTNEEADKLNQIAQEALRCWVADNYETDMANYNVFGTEIEITETLANGFPFTMRIDAIYEDKENGNLTILDHKVTKNKVDSMTKQLYMSEQAIGYIWGVKKHFGKVVNGLLPDVIIVKDLVRGLEISTGRGPLLSYSDYAIYQWELGRIAALSEMSQKTKTMINGDLPNEILFYRNPEKCQIFGCPYENICRQNITSVPPGFEKKAGIDDDNILSALTDWEEYDILPKPRKGGDE